VDTDLGKIYALVKMIEKEIVEIQTTQKIRHEENQRYMRMLDTLMCATHKEKINGLGVAIKCLWGVTVLIISWIVGGVVFGK